MCHGRVAHLSPESVRGESDRFPVERFVKRIRVITVPVVLHRSYFLIYHGVRVFTGTWVQQP